MRRQFFVSMGAIALGIGVAGIAAASFFKYISASSDAIAQKKSVASKIPFTAVNIIGDAMRREHVSISPYILVEFGDYQCPPCQAYQPRIEQLKNKAHGKLSVVFRHFPLTGLHPYAFRAAVAAEAAAEQGKFWEMHQLLYSDTQKLSEADLQKYANDVGLDKERFKKSCLTTAKKAVISDMHTGEKLSLQGTPSFLLCDSAGMVTVTSVDELERVFGGGNGQ